MTVQQFLQNLQQIVDSNPTYRTGGTGKDGTCDCVGAIMGALGGKFALHSSNYFARYQMRSLDSLNDESQLHPGSVVYKSRRDTSQLNERYLPGGTHHANTSLDYYHVGVVTSINPLIITHCTSSGGVNGFTTDNSISAWSWFGDLLQVEYGADEPEEQDPTDLETAETAVVYSADGNPVRLRSRPDAGGEYNTIAKVASGESVTVLEQAGEWATVRYNGQRGYMMAQFLRRMDAEPQEPKSETVTITIDKDAAKALYEALESVLQ